MKALVITLALLLAATSAFALTNGRDGSGGYGPIGSGWADMRSESDVLLLQYREANTGFGSLLPQYNAALVAAGATVSQIDEPSGGGSFPGGYDPVAFPVTFVITTENWWGPNFPPADENTVANYLNAGGALWLNGQDYLYGAGYGDGAAYGFPNLIGAGTITQDTPFGTGYSMDVSGQDIFAGYYDNCDAYSIFLANDFYPDTINPRSGAVTCFRQESPNPSSGGVLYDAGAYKAIFNTLEIAGSTTGQFDGIIAIGYDWLKGGVVASESTTWGAVKANFR